MTDNALTVSESAQLAAIEKEMESNFRSFVRNSELLENVRDNRLYRQDYGSFENDCDQRWGMSRRNADLLIEASQVTRRLGMALEEKARTIALENTPSYPSSHGPIPLPATESQARELARAPEEAQVAIWLKVIEATACPTAKIIKKFVDKAGSAVKAIAGVGQSKPSAQAVIEQDDAAEVMASPDDVPAEPKPQADKTTTDKKEKAPLGTMENPYPANAPIKARDWTLALGTAAG